jgi:hypothetical protein
MLGKYTYKEDNLFVALLIVLGAVSFAHYSVNFLWWAYPRLRLTK